MDLRRLARRRQDERLSRKNRIQKSTNSKQIAAPSSWLIRLGKQGYLGRVEWSPLRKKKGERPARSSSNPICSMNHGGDEPGKSTLADEAIAIGAQILEIEQSTRQIDISFALPRGSHGNA